MKLGPAERAVYMMLETGTLSPERSALFIRVLRSLVAARVARRNPDGSHELVNAATPPIQNRRTEPPPPAPEPEPELITVSARLPAALVEALDNMGAKNRSDAVRQVLGRALGAGSGMRRRSAS